MKMDLLLEERTDDDILDCMDRDALVDVVEVIWMESMDFLDLFDSYDQIRNVIENRLVMHILLQLLQQQLLMKMMWMLVSMNDVRMMTMKKMMQIFLIDVLSFVCVVDRNILVQHHYNRLMMQNYVNVWIWPMLLSVLVKPVQVLVYQVNNQYSVLIYYLNYL